MFYCRERELAELNRRYQGEAFQCAVIYGRRRIGKTALISEFCRDKPAVFMSAMNASAQANLEVLSRAIYEKEYPGGDEAPVYPSFDAAFAQITRMAERERLVFVIDEYPYLARADSSVSSRLQILIDHRWSRSRLFLILCGSSMSFMEQQVLGCESPLYGRRTCQFRIQPLTYREITVFNPGLSSEDQALVYGITGGVPHYINLLDAGSDVDEAVKKNLLDTGSYLFEEPENLLKQELREPAVYNTVIGAIASGASRSSQIAAKAGLDTATCAKYLRVLQNLGIIRKETPAAEKPGKKTIYVISDSLYRFWYRFVPKNISIISAGRIENVYEQAVKRHYPEFMGPVFEQMCREYLLRYADDLPMIPADAGQWWGTDAAARKEVQIDIVGTPADGRNYIIGSCKYRNEAVGVDEYQRLRHYADVFGRGEKYFFYIFSKGGFTKGLRELAEEGHVTLVTLDDLYR